ncbi:MAG: hypothetical protein WC612_06210 [Bdellovibrionales bacterium]|jgi:hypothetical protein
MIGILCGMKSEAVIADKIPDVMVGCSGARHDRAKALVSHMIDQGAQRLISFGLCGAVSPDLVAGDLLFGTSVMALGDAWEADGAAYQSLVDKLPRALCVSFWGGDRIAARAQDKAMIYRRTACMAVDMESHIVARQAHEAGIPFNVIRAVSDPFDMDLPPAALLPLTAEGGVDTSAVWQSIKKTPAQLFDLTRLGYNTFLAMRSLRFAVTALKEVYHEPASNR